MNKRLTLSFIAVVFLITILFTTFYVAEPIRAAESESITAETTPQKSEVAPVEIPDNSVLNLIPEDILGVIYCPSLLELDDRINTFVSEMMPQAGGSPELLAKILANSFGAGFESLAELEEIGLDLNQDFAVFLTSLDPPSLSATVHLTDPDAMLQVIEAEAEGSAPKEYNGITYWSSDKGSGSFAILENTLVFSQQPEVCENVIDITKGKMKSIVANQDYASFLTNILNGADQIAAYFNLESMIAHQIESIKVEFESMIDSMQSDPGAMALVPMVEGMFSQLTELLEEIKSVSATLRVEGTDVQFAPFLKFDSDGQIQDFLKKMTPGELMIVNDLPNQGFLNAGFQGSPDVLFEWGMNWLKVFTMDDSGPNANWEALLEQMKGSFESLADEWSFSANFNDSFVPELLFISELKNEQKMKTYMDEQFLKQFQKLIILARESVDDASQMGMFDEAYVGNPMMHNGVEIKTFTFPNFSAAFEDVSPEVVNFMPQEWHWSYAFSEDQFYFAIGGAELIKSALDSKAKIGESISENQSYQKLIEKLGAKNNLLLGFSPLTITKSFMAIVAKADPNAAAQIQMFSGILMGIPENYSIGFSTKVRDGGMGAKLLITLGDYKQLIQTLMLLSGM